MLTKTKNFMKRHLLSLLKKASGNTIICGSNSVISNGCNIKNINGKCRINGIDINGKLGIDYVKTISINNGRIIINGQDRTDDVFKNKVSSQSSKDLKDYPLSITELKIEVTGSTGEIESSGNVQVTGNVNGPINTNGTVEVGGNIIGNIDTNGTVHINGSVHGSIDTNGPVYVGGDVNGDIDAAIVR